ncbi:MAG: thermonuclease family protein [Planctomycetota bacterium]
MIRLAALLLILACPAIADDASAPFTAEVVRVTDGDTVTVLHDRTEVRIRLEGIDAPERGQAFGTRARQALSDACFGRDILVEPTGTDRYGRTIATLKIEGRSINLAMVRAGMAWHYTQFSDDADLAEAERAARKARRGLWRDPDPVPPWEWRRRDREK